MDVLINLIFSSTFNYLFKFLCIICLCICWRFFFFNQIKWKIFYIFISFVIIFSLSWVYSSIYIYFLIDGLPLPIHTFTVRNSEQFLSLIIEISLFFSFYFLFPIIYIYFFLYFCSLWTKTNKKKRQFLFYIYLYYNFLIPLIIYIELYASSWQILVSLTKNKNSVDILPINYDPDLNFIFYSFIQENFDFSLCIYFFVLIYYLFLNGFMNSVWREKTHSIFLFFFILIFYYFFGAVDIYTDFVLITLLFCIFEFFIFILYFLFALKKLKKIDKN